MNLERKWDFSRNTEYHSNFLNGWAVLALWHWYCRRIMIDLYRDHSLWASKFLYYRVNLTTGTISLTSGSVRHASLNFRAVEEAQQTSSNSHPEQNKVIIITVRNHLRHSAFDPELWNHFEDEAPQWKSSNIFNQQRPPVHPGTWSIRLTRDTLRCMCNACKRGRNVWAVNTAVLIDRAGDWIYSHHLPPPSLSPSLICSRHFAVLHPNLNIFTSAFPLSSHPPPLLLSFPLFTLTCFPPLFLWWGKANAFVYILPLPQIETITVESSASGGREGAWLILVLRSFRLHYRSIVEGLSIW